MNKHILYLASGRGSRFGENKLLYPLNGKPLFRHGLELLHELQNKRGDCRILVVSRYSVIRQAAEELGFAAADSPDSEKGVSYTIQAGLNGLTDVDRDDYLLFLVADQPYLTLDSLERLLDCADQGAEGASLCWGDRPGNPCLFSARRIPELLALSGDTGGRAVLKRHPCVQIQAGSQRELEDIDFKSDVL